MSSASVCPLISAVCQPVFVLCLMLHVSFTDIDECVNNTVCDSHGFCDNTAGSFRCLCYQGFQAPQDGQGCVGELLEPFQHVSCPFGKEVKTSTVGGKWGKMSPQLDFII